MKKTLILLILLSLSVPARAEETASHRDRGDALRAHGLFEEAVAEYKRALAEKRLLPADSGSVSLRDKSPLCGAIDRRRAGIAMRLSASEGR